MQPIIHQLANWQCTSFLYESEEYDLSGMGIYFSVMELMGMKIKVRHEWHLICVTAGSLIPRAAQSHMLAQDFRNVG